MNSFLDQVNMISPLTEEEVIQFQNILKVKFFKKGETILKINHINKNLFYINTGLVKLSFYKEDKEFVMRFFCEGDFCAALDSFVTQQPSNYTIVAIEDTEVIAVDYEQLNKLANEYHSIEKVFRKITSMATVNMIKRISEMLETNGTEAYLNFLKDNKHLMNRISLGDLSGYLGISQVSLSRIRSNI